MRSQRVIRPVAVGVACALAALVIPRASAVIVYQGDNGPGGEGRNTLAPPAEYADAWNLQGQLGMMMGTPIGDRYLLTAEHVTGQPQPFLYRGHTYTLNATPITIPNTDLRIWTLNTSVDSTLFPAWAQMWDPAVDGNETGKEFFVAGRSVSRGAAIYAPINPGTVLGPVSNSTNHASSLVGGIGASSVTDEPSTAAASALITGGSTGVVPDELRGWKHGTYDSIQSWGLNVVDSIENFDTDPNAPESKRYGDILTFDFDRPDQPDAVEHEGALANYDSGGGVFIKSNGVWKLAGINFSTNPYYAVSADGMIDPSYQDGYAHSAVMDISGLYTLVDDGPDAGTEPDIAQVGYGSAPQGAYSFASRVGASRAAILAAIGGSPSAIGGGPAIAVPEPAALVAIVGACAVAVRRHRRR